MTKEVIAMARESGAQPGRGMSSFWTMQKDDIERFATLVRNAALEDAAQFLYAEGEAVGGVDLDPYRLAESIESLKEPTT